MMDREYAEQYAETLLDYAFDMLWKRETCGVNHAEFIFVRLTDFIREQPTLKEWLLRNVGITMRGDWCSLSEYAQRPKGFVPSELAEYVTHAFRWPELELMSNETLQRHRDDKIYLMSRNLPSSILAALKDDWEDIDFYPSLRS